MKGYDYDAGKRMWYRHSSTCHNTPLTQKMLYLGKVVTDPEFKIVTSTKDTIEKVSVQRKVWQFWKPKYIEKTIKGGTNTKNVYFRYFCDKCGEQNDGEWKFRHKK